jgi:hypothetical protein
MIPQRLRELVRVVGIGQSQEHSGLTISLLSLEVYADGCLLLVLFQSYPTEFPSGHPIPEPVNYPVLVPDDRGGQYKVIPGNGSQLTVQGY